MPYNHAATAQAADRPAYDRSLRQLAINVDTRRGHVALHGSAPDVAARDRATSRAAAVEGVVAVDNQLTIIPKS